MGKRESVGEPKTCQRCEYTWTPRVQNPITCPRCKSYSWRPRAVIIYALQHPRTKTYFYVGATLNPSMRISTLLGPRIHPKRLKAQLALLKNEGLRPLFVILEETDLEHAAERENYWINYLKAELEPIVNVHKSWRGKEKKRQLL
jgi:hypothetical protein